MILVRFELKKAPKWRTFAVDADDKTGRSENMKAAFELRWRNVFEGNSKP